MYGYLTLEQCIELGEKGFAVICDADRQDTYIRDSEKECIASADISEAIKILTNIWNVFRNIFKEYCRLGTKIYIGMSD